MVNFGHILKDAGKTVKNGSNSISHVFTDGEKKAEKAVGQIYKDGKKGVSQIYRDGRSATAYTGKHIIGDVDNLTNALSSPVLWIAIGGVAIVVLTRR
jgi:hypothetical protein